MVVSGVPRATVVLLSKVAQGTIAHRSAVLAGQQVLMVRPRARHAMCRVPMCNDPPGMCTLPMIHISVVPERLRSVNRSANYRNYNIYDDPNSSFMDEGKVMGNKILP